MGKRKDFDICVGDLVRVRRCEDMVEEFGVRPGGTIPCMYNFLPEMRKFCGEEVVVKYIENGSKYFFDRALGHFSYSKDMLELVCEDSVEEPYDMEEINKFLGEMKLAQ